MPRRDRRSPRQLELAEVPPQPPLAEELSRVRGPSRGSHSANLAGEGARNDYLTGHCRAHTRRRSFHVPPTEGDDVSATATSPDVRAGTDGDRAALIRW